MDCDKHEKQLLLRICEKLQKYGLDTATLKTAIEEKNTKLLKEELNRLYRNADIEQQEKLERFVTLLYILDWK